MEKTIEMIGGGEMITLYLNPKKDNCEWCSNYGEVYGMGFHCGTLLCKECVEEIKKQLIQ